MSNAPKVEPKPSRKMTRVEELVNQLTNKHAQQRAVGEWEALIEIAKMDGTTVEQAFALVRDLVALRKTLALEAIAGELHGINQQLINVNLMQEMLHPEVFEKASAEQPAPLSDEEAEGSEPDSNQVMDPMLSGGTPANPPQGEQVEP